MGHSHVAMFLAVGLCRLMPRTSLRGKVQPLRVYEVTSRKVNPTVQ